MKIQRNRKLFTALAGRTVSHHSGCRGFINGYLQT